MRAFFTSRERKVIFFLSAVFLLGNGLRLYRKSTEPEPGESLRLGSLLPADSIEVVRLLEESKEMRDKKEEAKHVKFPVDINNADLWELTALPGIGPKRAERIIEEREKKDGFKVLTDLLNVPGIGEKTLTALSEYIVPFPSPDETETDVTSDGIEVNTASAAQFELLPGIGSVLAGRIIEEREKGGPFLSVDDLHRVKGIGERRLDELQPFLKTK